VRMHKRWLALLVLLVAVAFCLHDVAYGLNNVCLTVPDEEWQFEQPQPVSLYAWNIKPSGAWDNLPGRVEEPAPLVSDATAPVDRLLVRLLGCAVGLLTVALLMCLGRQLHARWWWLAGLAVAVAPWFVAIDRWTVRFDTAPLVV